MILRRPSGYGIGALVPNPNPRSSRPFLTSHNLYIYGFLALGIPGGLLAMNLLVRYLRIVVKRMRSLTSPSGSLLALWGFVVAILVYNLTNIFSISPNAYVLFALSAGMLLHRACREYAISAAVEKQVPSEAQIASDSTSAAAAGRPVTPADES